LVKKQSKSDIEMNDKLKDQEKEIMKKRNKVIDNKSIVSANKNNEFNNHNELSALNNSLLDEINIKIIHELLDDPNVKSATIALKTNIPQSTIQRRRSKLEESVLKKNYHFDLHSMGYRGAYLFVDVKKGKAEEIGKRILKIYPQNILKVTTRINSTNNLCIDFIFKTSEDLHNILEDMKSYPEVAFVDWSELVNTIGDNSTNVIKVLLNGRLKEAIV